MLLPLLVSLAACGGGGDGGGGGGGGVGGGTTVSFAIDVLPILVQDCIVCHGGSGGLTLDSYAGVLAGGSSGPAVIAGDPGNSRLVMRIEGTILPQMPLGVAPLTAGEIGRIRQWILEGALNN